MALRGDTVWPYVVFKDRSGVPTDPDSLTFALYDDQEKEIMAPVDLDDSYRATDLGAAGAFEYPLVLPKLSSGKTKAIWEFVGMVDGHPEVYRETITITFIA